MKVMVMVKATADSEAGVMPTQQLIEEMGAFNEELVKAGIILDGDGLHPSSKGARVRFSGKSRTVIDGPFAETKELVAGYWIWQVKSMEEAIEWVKKCPNPMNDDSEIEIRPFFSPEDFGEAYTPEQKERDARLRAEVESYHLDPPRWEVGRERVVAGLKGHFTNETTGKIPSHWCAFEKLREKLPAATGDDSYGVCWSCQSHGFDYLAGVELKDPNAELPEGVEKVTLAAQRYAIFAHAGHVSTLGKTCETIWSKWLPNSGHEPVEAPFFERYTKEFDVESLTGGIEIWIPIKG